MGTRAAIATQNNSIGGRQRTSVGFKLAVCGGTGALMAHIYQRAR